MSDLDFPRSESVKGEILLNNQTAVVSLNDIIRSLRPVQVRYIIAMMYHKTQSDALLAINLSRQVVESWPEREKSIIEDAISMIAFDTLMFANALLKDGVLQAAMVKLEGLNSEDEQVRQKVATELIEWQNGKAKTKIQAENTHTFKMKLYSGVSPDDWDDEQE